MTERAVEPASQALEDVKQQLLDRIQQERGQWEALLAEVGQERMEIPGTTGEWTFRDTVVHLKVWWRREVAREQRGNGELDEALRHRSVDSMVEGGENEKRGEPRPGQATDKGPEPLEND
jgi:hypothetical protein